LNPSERHQHVLDLFDHLCEMPESDRQTYLDEHCKDATLRAEVESLLLHDREDDVFLDATQPSDGLDAMAAQALTDESLQAPEKIGPYQIVRKIGEGGMGIIYEAEQESPKRRVALKVLKPGFVSRGMLRRFQHEAQILGQLQHPGIASIHEAGLAKGDAGKQPYFAMEFIEGSSLDEYVVTNDLSFRQRLELMARVCDAVHHAHQKGIIHRDLKPNNILVIGADSTSDSQSVTRSFSNDNDPIGQPKVLDFGIARITETGDDLQTVHTEIGQMIGTLAYMSPEQVSGDRANLDTRSDIYALGVILYELLTGTRPIDVSIKSIPEAARLICEHSPPMVGSIHRKLRGDVETIVAKSIEKNPVRRYQSAAEFAADIRRFLVDQPIDARPASTFYQVRKFASRNRGVFATASFAVIAILSGSGLAILSAIEANREREEKNSALEVSDAVTNFLADTLAAASPKEQGKGVLVKEVMDNAAQEVGKKFEDAPQVAAKIRLTIGRTYTALGDYAAAEEQLAAAIELWNNRPATDISEQLQARTALGEVYFYRGRADLAKSTFESVLEDARSELSSDDPELITYMHSVGFMRMQQGRYEDAEALFNEAKRLVRLENDPRAIDLWANLALLYTRTGRGDKAEPYYQKAIDASTKSRGADHPETLLISANLASLLIGQKKDDEAIELLEKTLEAQRRVLGRGHRQALITLNNIAYIYNRSSKSSKAIELLNEGLIDAKETNEVTEPTVIMLQLTLGSTYYQNELFEEAEAVLSIARKHAIEGMGENSQYTIQCTVVLARVFLAQSKPQLAIPLLKEAISAVEETGFQKARLNFGQLLAQAHQEAGELDDAEQVLLKLHESTEPDGQDQIVTALIALYKKWNRPEDVLRWQKFLKKTSSSK